MACLPGIPPVSLRIVTGGAKGKRPCDGWSAEQNQQTLAIKDSGTQTLKMMELWDYYDRLDFGFCFVFLYICLPELKVCIYFSLKRLVFNSGGNILLSK